ncbi:PAS domain S-box protein [Magnetospirillum sp. UT-4]|uniref:PAS domain S-box protein n=1 Tax=Magnetospirillum sp. UT-4 TaxID=2681467 RepID=UPI001572C6F9|nr:PAS domain S-box protein [Magnetospirillum sp. UT-4]
MSRLKLSVMIPFIGFVLLLAASVGTIEYQKFRRESSRVSLEISTAVAASFQGAVASESATLRALAQAAANDRTLRAAFRDRDRERLLALTAELFATLKRDAGITHLYFVDAARVAFLRVHQPERHGDVIGRHTMLGAERTGAVSEGIELGPLGTLTLRVVVPWIADGELLGYVETGKEIDHLFDALRRQFAVQPLLFLPKAALDRKGWEDGMAMLARPADWNMFPDVVLALGGEVPAEALGPFLAGHQDSLQVGDRRYAWLRMSVPGPAGETVATVGLVRDVTAAHDEMMRMGVIIAAIALAGSVAVILVFWLVIDRVEKVLMRTRDDLARREELYHSLFSGARIAMLLIDPEDGAIVDANDAACAYYGHGLDRLRAMRISDINTLSPAEVRAEMEAARAEKRSQFYFRHRLADGSVRGVEVHSGPIEVQGRTLLYSVIHDVTERRRLEAELKDSEERFRALVENTSDWLWETDENHCFTWFSPSMSDVLKIRPERFFGRRRWDMASETHEIDPGRWEAHIADLTQHRSFRNFRYWLRLDDGSARWISVSGFPRYDERGMFVGYRGSASDVTAFAESSLRLRTMAKAVEQSPVAVVITDTDGTITYANPHAAAASGYGQDELVGQNSRIFASGETAPDEYAEMWRTILGGGTWASELRNRKKDGSLHWEQTIVFPVFDEEGRMVRFVGIKEDVTERKAAEARLVEALKSAERAQRETALLLSSAGEGIFGIDVGGRVTFANPAACTLLGYPSEAEVAGKASHAVTRHSKADGSRCTDSGCAIVETVHDGIARRVGDEFFARRDGSVFPVEFSVTAITEEGGITEDGAITGAVVIFRDVGERRAAEQALAEAMARIEAQSAEVARINGELEQFAYVVSHDLRQPLRMISSYITLIGKALGGNASEDIRTYFDYAVGGAKRMDALIIGLLDYSRTGRNAGPHEPVALGDVVAESLANLEVAIAENQARIAVAPDLPTIPGDRNELVRLFQNLIGNAVKYRSPERIPEIQIGCREEGGEWRVWVRDNGIGIPDDQRERAFKIFQRLTTASRYEGTGIGLAICKKIVGHHGGRIWIEATEGGGSTFVVAFPNRD